MGKAPRVRGAGRAPTTPLLTAAATTTAAAAPAGKPSRPPTPFEARLYALCKSIPRGKVTTYGAMAEGMRRNPFAPMVPCHRVVASSLELGGFSGAWGLGCESVQRKRALLREEGVTFSEDGTHVDAACVLSPAGLRAVAPREALRKQA